MDTGQYTAGMKQADSKTAQFQKRLATVGRTLGVAFSGAIVATAARSIVKLVGGLAKAAAEIERIRNEFIALGVSVQDSLKHMEDLRAFATKTPFQLTDIAKASQQLLALSEGVLGGTESLKKFGDVAAATGNKDFANLAFWVGRLYAALASGAPFIESANSLLRLKAIAPSAIVEMKALAETGATGAELWDVYVKSLDRFDGALQRLSETAEGKASTLKDVWFDMKAALGEPLEPVTKGVIDDLTKLIPLAKKAAHPIVALASFFTRLGDAGKEFAKGKSLQQSMAIAFPSSNGGESLPGGLKMKGSAAAAVGDPAQFEAAQKAISQQKILNDKLRGATKEGLEKLDHVRDAAVRAVAAKRKKANDAEAAEVKRITDETAEAVKASSEIIKKTKADQGRFAQRAIEMEKASLESLRDKQLATRKDAHAERIKLIDEEERLVFAASDHETQKFLEAETKKGLAAQKRLDDRIAAEEASAAKSIERLKLQQSELDPQAVGIARSNLERMGGSIGPSRAGIGIADRQIRLAMESNRIDREILSVQQETRDNTQRLVDKAGGGDVE